MMEVHLAYRLLRVERGVQYKVVVFSIAILILLLFRYKYGYLLSFLLSLVITVS